MALNQLIIVGRWVLAAYLAAFIPFHLVTVSTNTARANKRIVYNDDPYAATNRLENDVARDEEKTAAIGERLTALASKVDTIDQKVSKTEVEQEHVRTTEEDNTYLLRGLAGFILMAYVKDIYGAYRKNRRGPDDRKVVATTGEDNRAQAAHN